MFVVKPRIWMLRSDMDNSAKTRNGQSPATPVIRPIGSETAAEFAAVEGLKMNATSEALSRKLTAASLAGDGYRDEIVKAFKKG